MSVIICYIYCMVQYRKDRLETGNVYHVYTRSIARFIVFNDYIEFVRLIRLLELYRHINFNHKLSNFLDLNIDLQQSIVQNLISENNLLVEIIAYCVMPTHIHLLLKQKSENGITKYMARVLNGYSRFFNTKHKRTGPLWSGRFKNVRVENDEQLLHLSRYIHLNPTSAGLIEKPEKWKYSSYLEYVQPGKSATELCYFQNFIQISPKRYKNFVLNQKDYQRKLSIIKSQTLDAYSG